MQIPEHMQYNNQQEARAKVDSLVTQGVDGRFLKDTQENIDAVVSFLQENHIGFFNGPIAEFAIRQLSAQGKLQWDDRRRRLKDGSLPIDPNDTLSIRNASKEQLLDVLHQGKPKYDAEERLANWQLPLLSVNEGGTLTRDQLRNADSRQLKDWAGRRRAARLQPAIA